MKRIIGFRIMIPNVQGDYGFMTARAGARSTGAQIIPRFKRSMHSFSFGVAFSEDSYDSHQFHG